MGVVRGGMAAHARPRGASRGRAGRARRAADRAPLRPPPRRALARTPCGARGGRLGRRAAARPRLHHRRPRLAPLRDAASSRSGFARSAAATSSSATTTSPTAAIRSRSASTRRRSPALEDVTLLGDDAVEVELRGRRVQIVGVDPQTYAARRPLRTRSRISRRTCGSSSATSRESSGASRASSTSSSPGTCTPVRSSFRTRVGGCGSRTSALATSRASTTTARRRCTCRPASARRSSRSGSSRVRR